MNCAYDPKELHALRILKEVSHWHAAKFISAEQLAAVRANYKSNVYHPNLVIRILLFIATCIAVSGANGLFFSMVYQLPETMQALMALVAGVGTIYLAQKALIQNNHHYRSGVLEAIVYCACAYIIGGVGLLTDWNEHLLLMTSILMFAFVAFWFLDLICTALATLTLAGFIFYECYHAGGVMQQLIPFGIIISFSLVYFGARQLRREESNGLWHDNLILVEVISLLMIYAGGNYFVVRECSIALLNLSLGEGEDIPFAFIFYAFTALTPLVLMFRGVQLRNLMLLRLGVFTAVVSVLTFRYYFSILPPEIALTVGGVIVLGVTAWLYSYLRIPRSGFSRDKLLSRETVSSSVTAFAVSQTMGGNVTKPDESFKGGGGSFGGGGASGDF